MIRIRVVARQGVALDGSQAVEFSAAGGTIGRADSNTLVLSDPERTVSRVHAQILCRAGQCFVVDRGSNPLQCNGSPLGSGQEIELRGGERLVLGNFELAVELLNPETQSFASSAAVSSTADSSSQASLNGGTFGDPSADPFADLLSGLPGAAFASSQPGRAQSLGAEKAAAPIASATTDDPFADLLAPAPARAYGANAGRAVSSADALFADDFSDLGLPAGTAPATALRIDELFGGSAAGGVSPFGAEGADPLALSALGDPLQPNTSSLADDPFAALSLAPAATPAPQSDHLPIAQFGFVPPLIAQARPAPVPAAKPSRQDAPLPVPSGEPHLSPLSPAPNSLPAQGDSTNAPALLAAFLRGIGPLHQVPSELTPALLERIGVLLRCSAEGTLQLLLARQDLKREVRAEVTMIAAQANNPLKFSPSSDVALTHLLGPALRGFMPAEDAMRDAYNDLRAHQFGVMMGMHAALEQLIARFAPEQLEKKISARSAIDSLFATQRKAKLWDQFIALYAGIAQEAEEDFQALFGKAFTQAYEEQIARLKQSGAAGGNSR